jgi:hypothetical protein
MKIYPQILGINADFSFLIRVLSYPCFLYQWLFSQEAPVIIDSLRTLVLQSDPVQVDLTINGNLPNGCTLLDGFSQTRQDTTFTVQILTSRLEQEVCTEALIPFSETLALEVADLPDGLYTIEVGDQTTSFILGDVGLPDGSGTSGAVIRGSIWHDYCDLLADSSPTGGCIDADDGSYRADGLLAEGESPIIGVEVWLSPGICPPDGSPASEVIFTTARTDGNGAFLFGGLPAGPHCVSINAFSDINIGILPPGVWTFPRVGEVSMNNTVELAPGEVRTDVNFGWDYQLAAAAAAADCANRVTYVADVTIPDNTVLAPGQEFVKTWRLRNDGDCAWTTGYALEFVEGDAMGFTGSQLLTTPVEPGQEAEITVTLTAPNTPGTYRSDWQLSNEQGSFFGLGANADVSFYVQIIVQ